MFFVAQIKKIQQGKDFYSIVSAFVFMKDRFTSEYLKMAIVSCETVD